MPCKLLSLTSRALTSGLAHQHQDQGMIRILLLHNSLGKLTFLSFSTLTKLKQQENEGFFICFELPSPSCPSAPDLGVETAPPSVLLWTLAPGTTNLASALATVAVEEFGRALLLRSGYAVLQVTPYDLTEDFPAVKNPVQAAVTLLWWRMKSAAAGGPGHCQVHPSFSRDRYVASPRKFRRKN